MDSINEIKGFDGEDFWNSLDWIDDLPKPTYV